MFRTLQQTMDTKRWAEGLQFVRFCTVGGSGVIVDMMVLASLVDVFHVALPLALSKLIAAEVAMINNFIWNDCWTFARPRTPSPSESERETALVPRQNRGIVGRFLRFNAVCILGVAIAVTVLLILAKGFHMNLYVSNGVAILCATAWNFVASKRFAWGQ